MGTKRNPAGQDIATPSKPVRKPPKSIVLTTDKFRALVEADARTLPALTSVPAVPSGHGLEDGKLLTCEQFAGAISVLWRQADQAFVGIGRLLNSAKERLEHGHFMRLVSQEVPFTHGTANKLMRVAASIDCGRLPEDRLPPSYATVYELSSLGDDELIQATDAGLLRPNVQRKEVVEFKKRLRLPPDCKEGMSPDRREQIDAEIRRLELRIASLRKELEALPNDEGKGVLPI